MNYKISYIMTTYNKLPYLQQIVGRLIANLKSDEEIVIVDGGSTDGTKEYLTDLHREGKIHQYISERDFGEAHGTNKALLMARGELIKLVTDDDAHYFPGIAACKEFMLIHPEIDFMGSEGTSVQWKRPEPFNRSTYWKDYEIWKKSHKPFSFCGLGWMWRKSSLPLLGLLDRNFIRMDGEYSLRVTAGKAQIAWYTGVNWARIVNRGSNTVRLVPRIREETKRLDKFYGVQIDPKPLFSKRVKNLFTKHTVIPRYTPEPHKAFQICDEWLTAVNAKESCKFLL